MTHATGFPPVYSPDAKILILGSLPGQKSIQENKYYAHPQNAFWPAVLGALDVLPGASYEDNIAHIIHAKIAIWDVIASGIRPGSLDSNIVGSSVVPNSIPDLVRELQNLKLVAFNGKAAEATFRRTSRSNGWGDALAHLSFLTLPSTSPANAQISKEDKLRAWLVLRAWL